MEFDFRELSKEYPELNQYYDPETNIYDFSSHQSISLLTHYILLHYFRLEVKISDTNLCPRITNRLAYLSFINDKLVPYDDTECCLIDIGTGYCCIYLLLLSRLSKWGLLGTEINKNSITTAQATIRKNNLGDKITLRLSEGDILPADGFLQYRKVVTICNPPFYSSLDELSRNESFKKTKKSELVALSNELVTEDGEYGFIVKLIKESLSAKEIEWFTSLIGKFDTISKVIKIIKQNSISNYFVTKLMPEKSHRTQRWIIGWSFQPRRVVIDEMGSPNINKIKIPVLQSFHKLVEKLENCGIKYHLSQDKLLITVRKDVWSRKYRRGGKSIEDNIGIKVEIVAGEVRWLYGYNFTLFESLANFVRLSCI